MSRHDPSCLHDELYESFAGRYGRFSRYPGIGNLGFDVADQLIPHATPSKAKPSHVSAGGLVAIPSFGRCSKPNRA